MSSFDAVKAYEITVNLHKISRKAKRNRKTAQTITCFTKFIQKQFNSRDRARFSPEVIAYIRSKGKLETPNRIRVGIERKPSEEDSEQYVFVVHHVLVGAFKGLKHKNVSE